MRSFLPLLYVMLFGITKIVYAQPNQEDFIFKIKEGIAFLVQYTGEPNIVKIPSAYKGMRVTAISSYTGTDRQKHGAFEGLDIDSVIIPSTIVRIGANAFYNCENLNNINIPSSVSIIGESAFEGCSNLQKIAIPQSVLKISNRLFANCTNLKKVILPNVVTSIGDEAFVECSSLSQITIPNRVAKIGYASFAGCTKLIEIKVEALKPPIATSGFLDNTPETLSIKVPKSQVELYRKSIGWREYEKQIVGY